MTAYPYNKGATPPDGGGPRNLIPRALGSLEDALARCRNEDMRTPQVYAALNYLEQRVKVKWPFKQFRSALDDSGSEGWIVRPVAGAEVRP